MMIERFHEAQFAVTDKGAQHALQREALRLTEGALFPIKDSYYVYSDEGAEPKREPMVSPDQAGVLQIINDLFLREPERFGNEDTRLHLKAEIAKPFKAFDDKRAEILKHVYSTTGTFQRLREEKRALVADLFGTIGDLFTQHCPHALKGISIALVGFDAPNSLYEYTGRHRQVLSPSAQRLFQQFDRVYDFYPNRGEGAFTLEAIDAKHPETKVDYVVTGNVLNDPMYSTSSHFVFLAAARMLKKGGRAIHLMGYSNHYYHLHINNPTMIALAGQKMVACLPTQHHFRGLEELRFGCVDFVMFEQLHPVSLTHAMVSSVMREQNWVSQERRDGGMFASPYIAPEAPDLPMQLERLYAHLGEMRNEGLR